MLPGGIEGMNYLVPENQIPISTNYSMMQNDNNNMMSLQFPRFMNYEMGQQGYEHFTTQTSSMSNNSTSDEAEQLSSIIDERKQRRMISNRESARRSRMRKQKHLDELWSQVVRLRTDNHNLIDKLNHATDRHEQVVQENARLKEENCDLRRALMDLQIGSPYTAAVFTEIPCNTGSESSDQSTDSSVDLLR